MFDSIVAVVHLRYDERDHLSFDLAERRRSGHRRCVESVVSSERSRIQRVNCEDAIDSSVGAVDNALELGVQSARG